jgi:hypothetical protein
MLLFCRLLTQQIVKIGRNFVVFNNWADGYKCWFYRLIGYNVIKARIFQLPLFSKEQESTVSLMFSLTS